MNLTALERSVRAVLTADHGAGSGVPIAQLALFLRTLVFFVAVAYVLAVVPVQPLAFLAGLLAVVPALIWHGLTTSGAQS